MPNKRAFDILSNGGQVLNLKGFAEYKKLTDINNKPTENAKRFRNDNRNRPKRENIIEIIKISLGEILSKKLISSPAWRSNSLSNTKLTQDADDKIAPREIKATIDS
jgi:hypothetical protein